MGFPHGTTDRGCREEWGRNRVGQVPTGQSRHHHLSAGHATLLTTHMTHNNIIPSLVVVMRMRKWMGMRTGMLLLLMMMMILTEAQQLGGRIVVRW